jgi:hypothetical protein
MMGLAPQGRGREPGAVPSSPAARPGSADVALRRAVLARLIGDPAVGTGHILVWAAAGMVTLSGSVTSAVQKAAAIAAAQGVRSVAALTDNLAVAVPRRLDGPAAASDQQDLEP